MLYIKEHDKSSVDKDELVKYHEKYRRKALGRELTEEETERISKYIDYLINTFVTRHFLAYDKEELLGYVGVMDVKDVTVLIWENHPVIFSDSDKEKIAQELIQRCIEYAKKKKVNNVRIFTIETEEQKDRYLELRKYFLAADMIQTHTVLCMENQLTPDNLKEATIHKDYHIESMNSQDRQLLMDCYTKIFAQALDNFTNSLDSDEHKVWNFTLEAKMTEESIAAKKDDEIVGMSRVVDYGDFMELGPIGVIPDHRGKGIGNVLMKEVLANLLEKQKTNTYLEVDITNTPAIKLYEKYGYRTVSLKHGFLWRKS